MFDLTGHVALVTGAGQNVGAGIARALAVQGAAVIVNDLVAPRADQVTADLQSYGHQAVAAAFDVTQPEAVQGGVAQAVASSGPIDILVNNAGIPSAMATMSFRDMPSSEWSRYIDLNLYGSMNCVSAVLDGMCERRWGRIVQISSAAGRMGSPMGIALYGAGKGGIEAFIRHLAQEVSGLGVTANSVALGLMGPVPRERAAAIARRIPVGRLGSPEDVGAAVVYVASEEASWLTGQTIGLNGGTVM